MPVDEFSYRRRVDFGECDPARIYYAPRAINFSVEAVESWFGSVLGVTWPDLLERHGLEATFSRVDCEYIRPLLPGQVFEVRLGVAGAGTSGIVFSAAGEGISGETHFKVHLVVRFVERKNFVQVPIPARYLERIGKSQTQCAGGTAGPKNGSRPDALPGRAGWNAGRAGMVPLTRQRRVLYGECGPSGRIYAPKVFEYAIEAIGEWFEEVPGISWLDLVSKRRQGAPFVSAACEYLRPMVPGQVITMAVRVTRLGRASIGFAVAGHDAGGVPCFDSQLAACYIDQVGGFRSMPIPEEFRVRIQTYQAACEAEERKTGK